MPLAGSDTDWREFRARLVASTRSGSVTPAPETAAPSEERTTTEASSSSTAPATRGWAHSLSKPEKGCLLLAHPMLFHSSQTYFHQAVILILGTHTQ